jgi:hypothetical protein
VRRMTGWNGQAGGRPLQGSVAHPVRAAGRNGATSTRPACHQRHALQQLVAVPQIVRHSGIGTTATIQLGPEVPQQGDLYTFHTAVGDLAVTLASAGTNTGDLKSAKTCLYALTTSVPFTVDGANSTGKFAGATGTGTAVFMFSGDDPKLSDGTCNTSRYAQTSAKTSVATLTATIKLTVKQ